MCKKGQVACFKLWPKFFVCNYGAQRNKSETKKISQKGRNFFKRFMKICKIWIFFIFQRIICLYFSLKERGIDVKNDILELNYEEIIEKTHFFKIIKENFLIYSEDLFSNVSLACLHEMI